MRIDYQRPRESVFHIYIAEASFDGSPSDMPPADGRYTNLCSTTCEYLDLRFIYSGPIIGQVVEDTADGLRRVVNGKSGMISLSAATVNFLGTSSFQKGKVERCPQIWRNLRKAHTFNGLAFSEVTPPRAQVTRPPTATPFRSIQVQETNEHGTFAYPLRMERVLVLLIFFLLLNITLHVYQTSNAPGLIYGSWI